MERALGCKVQIFLILQTSFKTNVFLDRRVSPPPSFNLRLELTSIRPFSLNVVPDSSLEAKHTCRASDIPYASNVSGIEDQAESS